MRLGSAGFSNIRPIILNGKNDGYSTALSKALKLYWELVKDPQVPENPGYANPAEHPITKESFAAAVWRAVCKGREVSQESHPLNMEEKLSGRDLNFFTEPYSEGYQDIFGEWDNKPRGSPTNSGEPVQQEDNGFAFYNRSIVRSFLQMRLSSDSHTIVPKYGKITLRAYVDCVFANMNTTAISWEQLIQRAADFDPLTACYKEQLLKYKGLNNGE